MATADDNTTPLLTTPATDAVGDELTKLDAALADWDQTPSDRWLLEIV